MTEDESTIQMGMMAAAESLCFGFGKDAEAGTGSGLLLPLLSLPPALPMSLVRSASDFAPLTKWAVVERSTSMGRPPFSKNFSVAPILASWLGWAGKGRERKMGNGERWEQGIKRNRGKEWKEIPGFFGSNDVDRDGRMMACARDLRHPLSPTATPCLHTYGRL